VVWCGVDGVVWPLQTAQTSGHAWGWGDEEVTTILAYTSHLIQYVTGMITWLTTITHGSRSHTTHWPTGRPCERTGGTRRVWVVGRLREGKGGDSCPPRGTRRGESVDAARCSVGNEAEPEPQSLLSAERNPRTDARLERIDLRND